MEHKAYQRTVMNSRIAVLFIHGFLGTPDHFDGFLSLLPPTVTVYNLLLAGHGKGVKDFSQASMQQWEAQVSAAVDELSERAEEIYIVAHSMGTFFAIDEAIRTKKVAKLFLLASPLKLSLKFRMVKNNLKVYFNKIAPDDCEALAAKRCCGITHSKNSFLYLGWLPRLSELFRKIKKTRALIPYLQTPCAVYQSQRDEMVSQKSIRYLEENPHITVKVLDQSSHYYYPENEWQFLQEEFKSLFSSQY